MTSHLLKKAICEYAKIAYYDLNISNIGYYYYVASVYSDINTFLIGNHLTRIRSQLGLRILFLDDYCLNVSFGGFLHKLQQNYFTDENLIPANLHTAYQDQETKLGFGYRFIDEYENLRKVIDEKYLEWDRRLVLADFCEENGGDREAEFWRWTAAKKKMASYGYAKYSWWRRTSKKTESFNELEPKLFGKLCLKDFNTNHAADNALMLARMC